MSPWGIKGEVRSPGHRGSDLPWSLRQRLVEADGSVGDKFRERRWRKLTEVFADLAEMRVVDLGGTASYWQRAPVRPRSVDILNLEGAAGEAIGGVQVFEGDACDPPSPVAEGGYDLVISNSVLEHVGGYERRMRFAEAVHALAPWHWVQTPYRYFPIEPHFLGPGFQFLPVPLRAWAVRHWPLVHSRPTTSKSALEAVLWTDLVGLGELRHLFPESQLWMERLAGIPKSITAIKAPCRGKTEKPAPTPCAIS